jgi:large subunit ribosomal protein L23
MNTRDVVIAPVITEKSMKDAGLGKYTFKVATVANKSLIKTAIEKQFKVKVIKITVSLIKGKTGRRGVKREEFVKAAWKKATVQLAKDQKIGLFDIGGKEGKK